MTVVYRNLTFLLTVASLKKLSIFWTLKPTFWFTKSHDWVGTLSDLTSVSCKIYDTVWVWGYKTLVVRILYVNRAGFCQFWKTCVLWTNLLWKERFLLSLSAFWNLSDLVRQIWKRYSLRVVLLLVLIWELVSLWRSPLSYAFKCTTNPLHNRILQNELWIFRCIHILIFFANLLRLNVPNLIDIMLCWW